MKENNKKPTHVFKNGRVQEIKTEDRKQSSWFKTDKDIDFENSFKFWFALMWQNHYIQIFLLTFIISLIELFKLGAISEIVSDNYSDEGGFGATLAVLGLSIPPIVTAVVCYKGFWQYFNDLKNNTSR